ncbi:MAG TPA: ribose-5-phosphate isomerase RpiA [Actinomycetota bacterium]|nr:ribose-5-phosphate isomerase RpiA [Actinomycetota bacterium]
MHGKDRGREAEDPHEAEKRAAAEEAVAEVVAVARDGRARVGLGTGSTARWFVRALARRELDATCVATSPDTERLARDLGLRVDPFEELDRLDVAVDGADQVAPDLWLVKGGGGAHTREKVVAAAAERFVVIVSSDKLVDRLGPPVPVEVLRYGLAATLRRLSWLGRVELRGGPPTPDGNPVADLWVPSFDPLELARTLDAIPGVVGHGLFPRELVDVVLVGRPDGTVERLTR